MDKPLVTPEEELFVRTWLRTNSSYAAGLAAFPGRWDAGKASIAGHEWPRFDHIQAFREWVIQTDGLEACLPDKLQLARETFALATNERTSVRDKLAALELYGKIMGHIAKPTLPISIEPQINDTVIMFEPEKEEIANDA